MKKRINIQVIGELSSNKFEKTLNCDKDESKGTVNKGRCIH